MFFKYSLFLLFTLSIILDDSWVTAKKRKHHRSSSSEEEPSGKSTSQSDESLEAFGECGKTYDLEKVTSVKIVGGEEKFCNWTILGSSHCQPEITCSKIQLKGDGKECEKFFLEIADGAGGVHRVCGKTKLNKRGVRASYGARDLFLTLKGHQEARVKCEAHCGKGKSLPDFLGKLRKKKIDNRCVCGIQNRDDRIVNGEDAKRNEFPWQVAVVTPGTRSPICGASLINDRFILTASHCFWFTNTTADQIEVLLHAHLLDFTLGAAWKDNVPLGQNGSIRGAGWDKAKVTDQDERSIRLKVAEIIMHPLFTERYDYDVALLRLKKPLDLSGIEATPICLLQTGDRRDFVKQTATVAGWGMPDELAGGTTRLLQKLRVPVLRTQDCTQMMNFDLTDRMLCAGFQKGGKDACMGDSGGPLVIRENKEQFSQIGVVSWGEGCARENRPGIYSKLTDMNEWVKWHTTKANAIWCRDSLQ